MEDPKALQDGQSLEPDVAGGAEPNHAQHSIYMDCEAD